MISKEIKSIQTTKIKQKETKPKLKSSVLFECNEEGCIKKFLKYSNLIQHLASRKHVRKPERYLLKDTAIRLYHSKLKYIENQEMVSLLLETSNIKNILEANEKYESPLTEEWALLKERKSIRLNEKKRIFG